MMTKKLSYLLCCILLCYSSLLWSAEPRQTPSAAEQARTLMLLNQPVVMLQAKFGLTTPEERVQRIVRNLRALNQQDLQQSVEIATITRYQQQAVVFSINKKPFMLLAQGDLDEGDDLNLAQASRLVLQRLENLRHALIEQYSPHYLLLSALKSVAGAAALVTVCWFAYRSLAYVRRYYTARKQQNKPGLFPQLRSFLGQFEVRLYAWLMGILCVLGFYLWISWVLRLFPYTRIWGMELGQYTLQLFQRIGLVILSALPGLCVVIAIFVITGFIVKLIKVVLLRVERGMLHIPGLHPQTVGVTRKLISVAVWLFALSAAYPFLPGANSLAFKGISVFFGLMLTLGSAGVMNHAMSGLVLTYSRALRKGDIIRVADNEGVVSEVGMLATKIVTRENYEVTVPNAVVVSGRIINLSNHDGPPGVNMTTSVTIGYDTPWRQVHAMLELAASRTHGLDNSQPPIVRQLSLMDWYIAYELQVRLLAGESLAGVRSELHAHIQDVFNEFDVQIMSPNFVSQPELPVLVKKEHWYSPPAQP